MLLLWVQAISSLTMLIIILLTQILIYPQFKQVRANELGPYVTFHIKHISWIVVPVMLIEFFSLLLLWTNQNTWSIWLTSATALLIFIWALTFTKIAPLHNKIAHSSDITLISTLLSLNRIRTLLWSVKSLSIFCLFAILITPELNFKSTSHIKINTNVKNNDTPQLIYKETISSNHIDKILSSLNAQLITKQDHLKQYIVRTPYLKIPNLITIKNKDNTVVFLSKPLLNYFNFGTHKDTLKWIQKKIDQKK